MRYCFLLFLLPSALLAQSDWHDRISFGFKVGSPLNDPKDYGRFMSNYKQSRWTGGPTVEVHLPYNFSIEFDALYRSYEVNTIETFRFNPSVSSSISQSTQKSQVWDLPLLLKYRFKVRSLRPFISAGYLFTNEALQQSGTSVLTTTSGLKFTRGLPQPLAWSFASPL